MVPGNKKNDIFECTVSVTNVVANGQGYFDMYVDLKNAVNLLTPTCNYKVGDTKNYYNDPIHCMSYRYLFNQLALNLTFKFWNKGSEGDLLAENTRGFI